MKNMRIIITIVSLLSFLQLNAQPDGRRDFDKFKALKISFMTEKLELTPSEAEKFWPIYNELDKKRFDLHKKKRDLEKKLIDENTTLNDGELNRINNLLINSFKEEYDLSKEYNEKFMQVLPIKKVVLINIVENDFRFNMIKEYREKR